MANQNDFSASPLQSNFIFSANTVSNSASETQKSVAADTNKKAVGKVIEKTISPTSANLKYNKIYIKNSTGLSVNLKKELATAPKLKLTATDKPQVLIVHTHTTECYMLEKRNYYLASDKTRSTKENENVTAVGKVLEETLKAKNISVIHATEKHDYPEYTGSYNKAADTIKKYLKKYPTIKVVIDLHRDSVTGADKSKTALVTKINGKKAAQLMLVSGCQAQGVEGFSNWKENFRLAIRLQQTLEVMYPSLARPILFTARRYNQHLTTGSLLIECGTEVNTLDEAKYSAQLLGNALAATLNTLKEK